jgi:hypothetical protein
MLEYSDFNKLMGFTSKKLLYIILNNVILKRFIKRISHFLQIAFLRFLDIPIDYCTQ